MKANIQKILCLLLILSFVVGCKADKSNDTQLVNSSILNGQKADEYEDEDLILSIASIPEGSANCTGVLISSNVVLTAAHCIKNNAKPSFIFLGNSTPYYLNRDLDNEYKYPVEKVIVHPSYSSDFRVNRGNDDLALIILKEKARAPFRPMKINDGMEFVQSGAPLHIAGFSWHSVPFITDIFERLNSEVTASYSRQNIEADLSTQFLTKTVLVNTDIKPSPESDIIYVTQFGGGACSGDSGGPTMIKSNNHLFLVGIIRSGSGPRESLFRDCEYIAKATSASFHKIWINEVIAEAGAEQPEFVSSIAVKNLDSKELACGKILSYSLDLYMNLNIADKEICDSFAKVDVLKYLISVDKKCQSSCKGIKGFEGQCDFYVKGAEQMNEAYKAKCETL